MVAQEKEPMQDDRLETDIRIRDFTKNKPSV